MSLSDRLNTIAAFVPRCPLIADIGADHGLLSVHLLQKGVCEHVLCTDLSAPSLEKAVLAAMRTGLSSRCTFCVGDGLAPLKGHDVGAVVIAGMGGETIAEILERGFTICPDAVFVLQPMSRAERLREALQQMNATILDEALALDAGRIYPVLQVRFSNRPQTPMTQAELFFGKAHLFRRDQRTLDYLQRHLSVLTARRNDKAAAGLDTTKETLLIDTLRNILNKEH